MISYCVAVYRPTYARLLLADLVRKTTVPFEILIWLNVADAQLDADIDSAIAAGVPLRVMGRTPHNIGMGAYRILFRSARYPLITQIDDDVVCISRGIAERADRLFRQFPNVRQLVADVWQDELTTGARPPMENYTAFDSSEGLYSGPIDGWFSIYHRSILPLLMSLPSAPYFAIGAAVRARLAERGLLGVLDRGMKVFHVIGPTYATAFGMVQFEIEKYQRLGRHDIVSWYQRESEELQPIDDIREHVRHVMTSFDSTPPTPRVLEAHIDAIAPPDCIEPFDEVWDNLGGVVRPRGGELVIDPGLRHGPGFERGLVSRVRYEAVELTFEACLEPGACLLAKVHQADRIDQTTNSYHLLVEERRAYLARHQHVFRHLDPPRAAWVGWRLVCCGGVLSLWRNDHLMHRVRDRELRSGFAFIGAQGGAVRVRALRLVLSR
jgi:hypothetical protein